MKKQIAFTFALIGILNLVGCSQPRQEATAATTANSQTGVPEFSYAGDRAMYAAGEPGVKTSGFVNTDKADIHSGNAAELAKQECTVDWNRSQVYLDPSAGIWKVVFFTEGTLGGCQTVYLDRDGKTVLIVYGE